MQFCEIFLIWGLVFSLKFLDLSWFGAVVLFLILIRIYMNYHPAGYQFSKDFIFGVADADLQVIGEGETLVKEGALPTMWTHTAKSAPIVFNNDTPLQGIDRYNRWQEDIGFIENLGTKHYRTSISMSRLLTIEGKVNLKAVEWYKNLFRALKQKGIKVYVTLYHWELPEFLHLRGGWTNPETIDFFVLHAQAVYEHFNEFIEEYFLINEHFCITFLGYHLAVHAPFESDLKKALLAGHYLLLAQGKAFSRLRELDGNIKISTVYNVAASYAASTSANDLLAQRHDDEYGNLWLMEPIYTGKYPPYLSKLFKDLMPEIKSSDMDTIAIGSKLNHLGINYYFSKTIRYDENSDRKTRMVDRQFQIKNGLGWPVSVPPVFPEGFYDVLVQLHRRYESFGLNKMLITENGTAWPSDPDENGVVDDEFRIQYVRSHLQQVHKAILAGVPVDGYFLWTLMDNYEWQEGYRPESAFGIVHVDRETMKRTPKKSYFWYKNLLENNLLY